jgi:5-(carboxyamino)imidazole ribonucleotide synthase
MLAAAGVRVGIDFAFVDADRQAPAGRLGALIEPAQKAMLEALLVGQDVAAITCEREDIPQDLLDILEGRLQPAPEVLRVARDRLREKELFSTLGIPCAPYHAVSGLQELERAAEHLGLPLVLKTRHGGYDGKGQLVIRESRELAAAWQAMAPQPCVAEAFLPFSCELSLIGVRSTTGEMAFYPLTRNVHHQGILRLSLAPHVDAPLERQAREWVERLLRHWQLVGTLAVEFFLCQGQLLANEMAPRPHNSGHWTMMGCQSSQFDNHLRAILGWPLGDTAALGPSAMVNFIGAAPEARQLAAWPGGWLYGKAARPGRKLGHLSLCAADTAQRTALLQDLASWPGVWLPHELEEICCGPGPGETL